MDRALKVLFVMLLMVSISIPIYASGLDGVVTTQESQEAVSETEVMPEETIDDEQPIQEEAPDTYFDEQSESDEMDAAQAIGDMVKDSGVDAESLRKAQEFLSPMAKVINLGMALVLGITSLLMMFVTALDLMYIAFPPVRDSLDGGTVGGQTTRGRQRGMRQPGMMQGMEMGMQSNQTNAPGGGLSAFGRWISDEAMSASIEAQGNPMMGQAEMSVKSMIFSYMKKRTLFLFLFGTCVVIFSSTIFTDLGIKFGMWVLEKLTSI